MMERLSLTVVSVMFLVTAACAALVGRWFIREARSESRAGGEFAHLLVIVGVLVLCVGVLAAVGAAGALIDGWTTTSAEVER